MTTATFRKTPLVDGRDPRTGASAKVYRFTYTYAHMHVHICIYAHRKGIFMCINTYTNKAIHDCLYIYT